MPKVSIITASYNYEQYIRETIESILNQTFQDWEMIIVDDGSKDNSVEVIKSYCEKDNRIKLYQHENGDNKGLISTLKLGIEKSQGEWVAFLESDDSYTDDCIEERLKIAEKYDDVRLIFNDIELVGNKDYADEFKKNNLDRIYQVLEGVKFPSRVADKFKTNNLIFTFSAVMVKKDVLAGLDFNSCIPKLLDYYLWTQLANKYDFYYLNKKITRWRVHETSYVNAKSNPYEMIKFLDIQIADNLSENKHKLAHRMNALLHYLREFKRYFIRIHIKDGEIILFGRKYNLYGRNKR